MTRRFFRRRQFVQLSSSLAASACILGRAQGPDKSVSERPDAKKFESMVTKGIDFLRVVKWIGKNYDLKSHPGQGSSGLYYYYHTFAKALDAYAHDTIEDDRGQKHTWRVDLTNELASRQREGGSWVNENQQFFEGDANLCTSFALLALSHTKPKAN